MTFFKLMIKYALTDVTHSEKPMLSNGIWAKQALDRGGFCQRGILPERAKVVAP